jgi:uncharacterized protein
VAAVASPEPPPRRRRAGTETVRQDRVMTTNVKDNPDENRYEVYVDDALAGFTEYYLHGGVIAFLHTEIDPALQGQGLASTVIQGALDDARKRGLAVEPFCPFVRLFIKKHADYRDLVPAEQWARFDLT